MKRLLPILLFLISAYQVQAQSDNDFKTDKAKNKTFETFKDTRVINTHSVETLKKRKLDIRIGHRFGDIGGGWPTLYGLENSTDVLIGGEYGVTDDLTVGIARTKGAGPLKALMTGIVKYKIFEQSLEGGSPITVTALGVATVSTMTKSDNPALLNFFEKSAHRWSYAAQLIIARKFGERFSLQFIPGYLHRNIVLFDDENDLLSLGFATRIQLTKVMGLIIDYTIPVSEFRSAEDSGFHNPLGIGLEFDTGGHVFQLNFTNATGIVETDYIPYTQSNWGDGEFRMGFTISRLFNL